VDSQPEPEIQISGYRIEARVGRGGMGEVYRAVQLNLERRVALKVLAPGLAADDVFRRRFLRESRIAASIDHPSILPIYETGEEGGLLYIAMRYVDGMDLATLLKREGRLAPAPALAIMTQVASALDAAHARGLVHRDVKPANILLAAGPGGSFGHCYLCDFGLIKQVGAEQAQSALTATDQFVGTIPYVAPEQIEGGNLDGRTDVYSLGCVLFHCLTGLPPFEGDNDIEVIFAHMREPPPPATTRAPDLPPAIDPILTRAMSKSKGDRWPTCSAMIAAMQTELRVGAPGSATPEDETRSMVLPPMPVGPPPTPPAARPLAPPAPVSPVASGSPTASAASGSQASLAASGPAAPPAAPPASAGSAADPAAPRVAPLAAVAPVATPAASAAASHPGPADPAAPAAPHAGPPVGEPIGTDEGAPTAVHRGYRERRAPRRSRGWLAVLTAIVLTVGVYLATVQYLSQGDRQVAAAPVTTVAATQPPTTAAERCPSRFTRPEVGSAVRTAPLAAIRSYMGWTDLFVVDEMRTWRGSGGQRHWYVKAHQEQTPSRRGRWLVREAEDGSRAVVASSAFGTRGFAARDWRGADGQDAPADVAGCLADT